MRLCMHKCKHASMRNFSCACNYDFCAGLYVNLILHLFVEDEKVS